MALDGQQSEDVRATLALSQNEAQFGTTRTLNLPGGRQLTLSLPAGLRDGQILRLEGQGQLTMPGGQPGALILTIAVAPSENFGFTPYPQSGTDFPTEFIAPPPPPPIPSSLNPGSDHGMGTDPYSNYGSQRSMPIPAGQPQPVYPQSHSEVPGTTGLAAVQQQERRPGKGLSTGLKVLLIVLALLVIGGSGLIFYVTVYQPDQLHAQATATAQTQANANATSTAVIANQTATQSAVLNKELTATATAYQTIYSRATSGTPVLDETLTGNGGSRWDETNSCLFTSNGYQVSANQKGFFTSCAANATNFGNFAFQVQMDITKGDSGGMIFRANNTSSKFFLFNVGNDGSYDLYLYIDNKGNDARTLVSGTSDAVKTGYKQLNELAAVAQGNNIYLYINKTYVNSYLLVNTNGALNAGQIGLIANAVNGSTQVIYSKAQVWKL